MADRMKFEQGEKVWWRDVDARIVEHVIGRLWRIEFGEDETCDVWERELEKLDGDSPPDAK